MIKSELISNVVSAFTQLNAKDVELGVNQILKCISDALHRGQHVEIRDFGSFDVRYRPARIAHNPKTGARVTTKAKYTPHFKPGKELRDMVNATSYLPITKN